LLLSHGCLKALMGALSLHHTMLHTLVTRGEKDGDILAPDFSKKFFALQAPKIESIWDSTKLPGTLDRIFVYHYCS
jgi:hypothetical protein